MEKSGFIKNTYYAYLNGYETLVDKSGRTPEDAFNYILDNYWPWKYEILKQIQDKRSELKDYVIQENPAKINWKYYTNSNKIDKDLLIEYINDREKIIQDKIGHYIMTNDYPSHQRWSGYQSALDDIKDKINELISNETKDI